MKMRQFTAILLTALLTLSLLAGCDDSPVEVTADPDQPAQYAETVGDYFTCVATDSVRADAVNATVCEAYQDLLGSYVRIEMDGLGDLNIAVGDELRVKVDHVEATKTPVVHAAAVQVIALGENHASDGETAVYVSESGHEFGPYSILALSEITISKALPSVDEMKAKSFAMDDKDGERDFGVMRVVEIRDDVVYLANIYSTQAAWALVGIPDVSFAVGDHVSVKVSKYCSVTDQFVNVIYLEDVLSFGIPTDQEIAEYYFMSTMVAEKPVIYLYPEEETVCSVKVNLDGTLTCTYPDHGTEGWQNFTAMPDGTLIFPDGSEYYCLYWEGKADLDPDFSRGFCVKGSDTAAFLAEILPEIGLTAREANEFIIYWLPILQNNPYNLISFQDEAYTSVAELEINPAPDSLLRVYMTAKPLSAPVEIEPQTFDGFERSGFTVVEWGGSLIEE